MDTYTRGRQIPSCQILVEWADSEQRAVKSVHKVTLQGTNEPTFFQIECKPIATCKSITFIMILMHYTLWFYISFVQLP